MYCESCGAQLSGQFCTACGARAREATLQAAAPTPSAPVAAAAAPAVSAPPRLASIDAKVQAAAAAKRIQGGVGALVARMGGLSFGAAIVLWISWFFFPAAILDFGPIQTSTYTFWGLLGADFGNTSSMLGGSGIHHGLFSLLGLLCIAAPFAAPFLRMPWVRYLNAVPLAFFLIGFVWIWIDERNAFSVLVSLTASNSFTWNWLVVLGLAATSALLARKALEKPAH